jgi:hypothetical protein
MCGEAFARGYFIALLGDGELAEHQPRTVSEDRDQMRGHRTHPARSAQRLAIQSDSQQPAGDHRLGGGHCCEVRPDCGRT